MTRRVLLVEDDPLVRRVVRRVLSEFAMRIVEAEDGHAALEAIANEDFDLVVSDLRIPGPDGIEILRTARARNPDCHAILVSGYADDAVDQQVMSLGGTLIHKPFGAEEIREAIKPR